MFPKTKFLTPAFYVLKFCPPTLKCLILPPLLIGMDTRNSLVFERFPVIKKNSYHILKAKANIITKFEEICLAEYLKNL
jgi:hypothetical protein